MSDATGWERLARENAANVKASLDDLAVLTAENASLRAEVERLTKERDEAQARNFQDFISEPLAAARSEAFAEAERIARKRADQHQDRFDNATTSMNLGAIEAELDEANWIADAIRAALEEKTR